jgi:hypothetical protein
VETGSLQERAAIEEARRMQPGAPRNEACKKVGFLRKVAYNQA